MAVDVRSRDDLEVREDHRPTVDDSVLGSQEGDGVVGLGDRRGEGIRAVNPVI
jgi:hypothetical protein